VTRKSAYDQKMDAALIERARAGDRTALEQLLEEIAPLVHRFGLRMCRHAADAEDVLQDTLLSVVDHLQEFQGRASLASWVFMLARTACARRRRGLKNQPHLTPDAAGELASSDSSPELATGQKQLRVALERALAQLSEEQREVLLLRDMEGLSAPEVAESLGLSVEAVKSRLHRSRAKLREALQDALGQESVAAPPGCPDVIAAFSRKLEGDLGAEDCAVMEKHLETCAGCSAACSTLRSALGACRTQAAGDVPAEVKARIKAAVRKLAARAAP
jgi:RNA polymerase sigma-70 factor (ECF subfamily)